MLKNKILSVLSVVFLIACGVSAQIMPQTTIDINNTNFPDDIFRSWILEQDYGKDGKLTEDEIAAVTEISVEAMYILSIKGIEHFTALTELLCDDNYIRYLDVSSLINLEYLVCEGNQLTNLDISKLTKLNLLDCSGNQLTTLDLSKSKNLQRLYCYGNQLTTLDLSELSNLQRLDCSDNQLTTLDLSELSNLQRLECSNNQLNALDVSGFNLSLLVCSLNHMINEEDVTGFTGEWDKENYIFSPQKANNVHFTEVTLASETVYNAEEQKPVEKVMFGDIELIQNTDYEAIYADNINAGTATVTIKGIGEYFGEKVLNFTINKAPGIWVPVDPITKEYSQGLTLADIELPDGYSWTEPTTGLSVSQATEYDAVMSVDNYTPVTGTISVTITQTTTAITDIEKTDNRNGIIRFNKKIVSDKAEMTAVLPNEDKPVETKIAVYDATGNIIFETTEKNETIVWNLTNKSGRFAANGTYLLIAEIKGLSKKVYLYSTKFGIKR